MASRLKEDEKNEKIIRGLLKLPANRRCINCNSLGPQYVCTNFWTFVCTTCGGIHREFTHRVKSVSMAKFTSQEVSALQGGGNECAREIYFKEWDSQRHSQPDGSNVERLRDFIKHVYVDRRYTGDRNIDKPPRVKMGDREDSIENRRFDTYRGGSRSPPYEDAYERRNERHASGGRSDDRNFRYSNDERRSPGYDQQSQRQAKRSPARFEVVDDRFRDDRPPNGRRFEDRRSSDGDSRLESKSPNHQKDLDASSPPMVRPVRDILGEDVPPLRVGEPPKENNKKAVDGSAHTQRTASSSSLGSLDGNPVEPKKEISGSLIDFDADPAPPVVSDAPQAQPTPAPAIQSAPQSATSSYPDNNNWASFAFGTQEKVSQGPSNVNTLESVLSQLSAPAAPPVSNMSSLPVSTGFPAAVPVSNISMSPPSVGLTAATLGISSSHGHGAPVVAPAGNISVFPVSGSAPMAAHGGMTFNSGDTLVKASDGGIWANGQQLQHSLFTSSESQSAAHQASRPAGGFLNNQLTSANGAPNNQLTPSVSGNPTQLTPSVSEASNNQQLGYAIAQNVPGTVSTPTPQPTQSKPVQDASSGVPLQPAPVEAKPTGRKELPQDLFTSTYSSIPTLQGWQTRPHHGMGFGMQYPTAMPIAAFPNSAKSSNPFDLSTEPSLGQASVFPSMASMQGALPNMVRPTNLLRTASVGNVPAQWMHPQSPSYASTVQPQSPSYASALQPQSPSYASALQPQSPSYASALRPQSQSYASALPPSAYMGQQASSNMLPFGHQGAGGAGNDGAAFGNLSMDQHLAGRYSLPATPNSFSSVGGNPFG